MKHYSVMHLFQFRVKRSSARRIVDEFYWLICVGENCIWHFKATSINDSAMFKVRNFNSQHTCSLMDNTFIQHKPTAMVVGRMVIPKFSDPKTIYTPKDIQFDMLSEHNVNLTYMQAWRAKEKALQFLRGHPADSYSKLPSFLYILEKTYPGSVVKLKKTDDDCFLSVVIVDETFLKSAYRGIMLTTSTMDAAGTILPLAYVVVYSENDASWKWFFEQFKLAYARSYTLDEFNERMSNIEEIDSRVKAYLYDIGYHRWSRVHDTVRASTHYIHTVLDGVRRYIVCLENKRYSCGQFQLDELPCPHALDA
ncbi:uncharacterized protein LOC142174289 [Nicotiana tabacum]|uniref:Uncharacterized protein LOC142174289 n=1 Tax=Nicotiana tabacum TaxID=4097 RepID=A0AC58TG33_TOBAC